MVAAYIGKMVASGRITIAAAFQAADFRRGKAPPGRNDVDLP